MHALAERQRLVCWRFRREPLQKLCHALEWVHRTIVKNALSRLKASFLELFKFTKCLFNRRFFCGHDLSPSPPPRRACRCLDGVGAAQGLEGLQQGGQALFPGAFAFEAGGQGFEGEGHGAG